jgi:hypothetical protein
MAGSVNRRLVRRMAPSAPLPDILTAYLLPQTHLP